jgi:hypothetical protein
MSIVYILHLSDLHFQTDKNSSALAHRTIAIKGLLKTIQEQDWKPNIIVVSGDIGWKGKEIDYNAAKTWFSTICKELDIPSQNIILVPGNHDVDYDDTIGMSYPDNATTADQWLSLNNLSHFETYFKNYIHFCDDMHIPNFTIGRKPFALTGIRECMGIRFVGLNSAWFCRGKNDRTHLWLGLELMKVLEASEQLKLNNQADMITIAVFHHPFEWFNDADQYTYNGRCPALEYIYKRSHIVLCGHVHSENIVQTNINNGAQIIIDGATYGDDSYHNNLSILRVDTTCNSMQRRTFEYKPENEAWVINQPEPIISLQKDDGISIKHISSIEFRQETSNVAKILRQDLPRLQYQYTIGFADNYSMLKNPEFRINKLKIDKLMPDDINRGIVLHGGGGTGKTTILKRLYIKAVRKKMIPIWLNLKDYINNKSIVAMSKNINDILQSTCPQITQQELKNLIQTEKIVIFIDSFSEVSNEIREIIAQYIQVLISTKHCYALIADRLTTSWDYGNFKHAKVNYLDKTTIQSEFINAQLGNYDQLDPSLQEIYKNPFFLNLAIQTRNVYHNSRVKSSIFNEFFQYSLSYVNVDDLAKITFESICNNGKCDYEYINNKINYVDIEKLKAAEVLNAKSFQHHLWVDYLVSRYLSQHSQQWNNPSFDKATLYSSATIESLMMTIEQLNTNQTDTFIKCIFDWNLTVAVQCVSELCNLHSNLLTRDISFAIIANTVEKRYDAIERTRNRACKNIKIYEQLDAWKPFIALDTQDKLFRYINTLCSDSNWFNKWKQLFTNNCRDFQFDVSLIKDKDPLIGWTVANLVRRRSISELEQDKIRQIFKNCSSLDYDSVRWRAVHCLGKYPNEKNAALLFDAVINDPYHWVRYGATRALIEIAAKANATMCQEIMATLPIKLSQATFKSEHMRRQIITEAIEASFIRHPILEWKNIAFEYLQKIVDLEPDPIEKENLQKRINDFVKYDINK